MEPLKTFIIYSSKDRELREELEGHLRPLVDLGWLDLWSDKEILPGERWDATIKKRLSETKLFLMLVSVDFYNSGYIREEEFKTAVALLENGDALVIPIIVRHCTWKFFPVIKDLQVLPQGGIAVTDLDHWKYRDKAWDNVVGKIGERVQILLEGRSTNVAIEKKPELPQTDPSRNGHTKRDLPDTPEMVFVEGGTFKMGGNDRDSEKPIHDVKVPSFWIGKYPVTFGEYEAFCSETNRDKPVDRGWGRGRRPVINVSWHDAEAYCEWLSGKTGKKYRLPSEAEWEFAARGGILSKGYKYAGNNDPDRVAWHSGNSGGKTQPVGEKEPNELGLYDMSGNVWEWCADHWHDNYEDAPKDGSAWTSGGDLSGRVLRGGSWDFDDYVCQVSVRYWNYPNDWVNGTGFRLAQDK